MVNDTFPPSFVCRHMISVLASKPIRPNAEHAFAITVIILSSPFGDRDTMPASSAYSISHLCTPSSPFPPRPSISPVRGVPSLSPFSFRWSCTMLSMMAASASKRFSATRSTAVKNMLNSSGASTHPCRRPCPTSLSEHFRSSNRMHAYMPSWNRRMTARILGGTPKRARTSHRRVRSTKSFALVRSIKHKYKRVSFFRSSSCSRRSSSCYEHHVNRRALGPKPTCSSGKMYRWVMSANTTTNTDITVAHARPMNALCALLGQKISGLPVAASSR